MPSLHELKHEVAALEAQIKQIEQPVSETVTPEEDSATQIRRMFELITRPDFKVPCPEPIEPSPAKPAAQDPDPQEEMSSWSTDRLRTFVGRSEANPIRRETAKSILADRLRQEVTRTDTPVPVSVTEPVESGPPDPALEEARLNVGLLKLHRELSQLDRAEKPRPRENRVPIYFK